MSHTETLEHAENPYDVTGEEHQKFQPEDYESEQHHEPGGIPWKLMCFLSIPFLEVIGQAIFKDESIRAVIVAPALLLTVLLAAFDSISQARLRNYSHSRSIKYGMNVMLWLGGVGVFALALAIGMRNEGYYIAADIYHWYFEFLGVAALGIWAFSSYSSHIIARSCLKAFLLLGMVGCGRELMGVLGINIFEGGGNSVAGTMLFRLELGRGFPMIPLLMVSAALLYAPRSDSRFAFLAMAAGFLLLICLMFTFKRTQWLLFPVLFIGMCLPKRVITASPFFLVAGLIMVWAFSFVSPNTIPALIDAAKQQLTYSDNWSIDDTLINRQNQVDETFKVCWKQPIGHGFGAEVQIPTPNGKRVEALHYVHSLYAYYALQFGFLGGAVAICVILVLSLLCFISLDMDEYAQWMVRAGLFGMVAFAGSGITLVSIHTTFAGLIIAVVVTGLARCTSPHREDDPNAFLEEEEEEWQPPEIPHFDHS
jgi:O-Antigen ligase